MFKMEWIEFGLNIEYVVKIWNLKNNFSSLIILYGVYE